MSPLSALVKQERKRTGMTQEKLALTAGVGLRFVRDLEQGKTSLRMDKVDQVLRLFGYRTGPIRMEKPDA
ncbi:MAG: helix-turn-helix transcriptional regulator [Spirochaetia bacterium]|jgi:y4mF family transcriptional regulator|nr:helix-turn-helix transcriptional regulator [Spirochaetia bacterium]